MAAKQNLQPITQTPEASEPARTGKGKRKGGAGQRNPFRGVLEGMTADYQLQVELGLIDPDDEMKRLVQALNGDVFGVTLKRLRATEPKEE